MDLNWETLVKRKLSGYRPLGNLDHTARLLLNQSSIHHGDVKNHFVRVSLLCEAVAKALGRGGKEYFFCGLLHDAGKPLLPHNLFDGHNISSEEYREVKGHARAGFDYLKDFHLFSAVVAGIHHNVYKNGYGVEIINFPKRWSLVTIKKAIDTALVVSICDFIDAFTHRKTTIKDGTRGINLRSMLCSKYPDDRYIINLALQKNKELGL